MNPRVNYEMSQEDLDELLESCKPVPYMVIGGSTGPSQQERANLAWGKLGKKMGFDSETVEPSPKSNRFFSAVPSETEPQKQERLRQNEISTLTGDVANLARTIGELGSVVDGLLTRLQKLERGGKGGK